MVSKKLSSLLALGLALTWHSATAQVQRVPLLVHVEAHVPSEQFSVAPLGWDHTVPVALVFDSENRRLRGVNRQIKVTSNVGDVSARLEGMAILTNGTTSVPLNVTLGDHTLSMLAQRVVSHDMARSGTTVGFGITPGEHPPKGLATGNYSGVVSLLFESNPASNGTMSVPD